MPANKNKNNSVSEKQSGSLKNSEPEFLAVGKIGKTHGLRGELWMNLLTDFPERLDRGKHVYIGRDYQEYTIKSFQLTVKRGLISFPDFKNLEDARVLINQIVYVKAGEVPKLSTEEYYHHELIGIKVIDEKQQVIGILIDIIKTGANDVYIVRNETGEKEEVLIPAIKSVIIKVDIQDKIMVVRLQEWA